MTHPETNPAAGTPLDLEWDAFRYVADEMTPEERTAFESRLADDVVAAEAVVAAVRLTQAVAAAETHCMQPTVAATAPVAAPAARSHRWLIVVASVCSLLAAFALGGRFAREQGTRRAAETPHVAASLPATGASSVPHGDIGALVDLWVTSEALPTNVVLGDHDESDEMDDLDGIVAVAGGPRDLERAPLDVPGWMLAAVEEGAPRRTTTEPDDEPARDN